MEDKAFQRKKSARFIGAAGCMLLWFSLAGCAYSDILNEIPRDLAYSRETVQAVQEPLPQSREQVSKVSPEQLPQSQTQVSQAAPEQLSQSPVQGGMALGEKEQTADEGFFLEEEANDFACRSLNEAEAVWYHDIESILGSFGEKVRLSEEGLQAGLVEKDIDRIFQCVLNDHPELFYVEGYSYVKYSRGDVLTAIAFSGTYSMDRETAVLRREEIEKAAEEILAGISAQASDYDKVKYVYDTVITATDYELQAPDNQNIYSVLVNHRSVCQGYAKATQYLLNRLGVECTLVLGTVKSGEGHAWNLAKVDGSYYYLDTTWGDASYQMGETGTIAGFVMPAINYDYLNITTQELVRTHTVGGDVPMPLCTAKDANYYVREGAWFDSCDIERIGQLFDKATACSKTDVTIKCADANCYEEMMDFLIRRQKIFEIWKASGSHIAYAQNENQLSMTFWMTND